MTVKITHFLLSLAVAAGSTVTAAQEVPVTPVIQVAQATFTDQIVNQANTLVERTVNLIATPFLSDRDLDCLARNIYYESGSEPTEGKIAVAIVTLNRAQDPRFGHSICEVVRARTVVARSRQVQQTQMVRVGFFGRPEPVTRTTEIVEQIPVCQFSWTCSGYARKPKLDDARWVESQAIAAGMARGDYTEYRAKYGAALYFHAAAVRPVWARTKKFVTKTGQHLFYE